MYSNHIPCIVEMYMYGLQNGVLSTEHAEIQFGCVNQIYS